MEAGYEKELEKSQISGKQNTHNLDYFIFTWTQTMKKRGRHRG